MQSEWGTPHDTAIGLPKPVVVRTSTPQLKRPTIEQPNGASAYSGLVTGLRIPHGERREGSGWEWGLNEGVTTAVKLAEMYDEQDGSTFEERRAEVVEIVRSATDFAGVDQGLQAIFQVMSAASDEQTFDEAFDNLTLSLAENTSRYLQTV